MELDIYSFDLALRYPFAISRHTYQSIRCVIVELREGRYSGYGEATTNPYYQVTEENLHSSFEDTRIFLKDYRFSNPEKLWSDIHPVLCGNTFAQSALDCAAHDLFFKMKGKSFLSQWGIAYQKFPFTSYTIGMGAIKDLKNKIKDLPWPVYKLKVSGGNDAEIVKELRQVTRSLIRVDANCSWPVDESIKIAGDLGKYKVELIEQPFNAEQLQESSKLTENCSLPIIADESCQGIEDIEKCAGNFDGINIKLAKCGGLTPAFHMMKMAREAGLKVMIGCMTESSVGISAAVQLLPFVDYADLDGPLLLSEDVATGLAYQKGSIIPGVGKGLGFDFKQKKFSTLLPE
jgi:L-alanine-DL-glutamate epimerase-like enolase superfamily enzyme